MCSVASWAWHASNCTELHFLDMGLMNCVICFFPLRFVAMGLATLARRADNHVSTSAALAYGAVCAAILHQSLALTPLYHSAFREPARLDQPS